VYYGGLRQNLHHLHVYYDVSRVNSGKTPESGGQLSRLLIASIVITRNIKITVIERTLQYIVFMH